MKHKIIILNGESFTPSTLLIPAVMMDMFNSRVTAFGCLKHLFHFIVNSKHPVYNGKPRSRTGKIEYQPDGLNLQRVNFFPNQEDWEQFRTFAYLQRISMTWLFVMILLEWDKFENRDCIVPKIPEKILFKLSLTIQKSFTYLELQHLNL